MTMVLGRGRALSGSPRSSARRAVYGTYARRSVVGAEPAAGAEWAAIPGLVTSLASAGVPIYRVAPQEATLEYTYFALQTEKEEMS